MKDEPGRKLLKKGIDDTIAYLKLWNMQPTGLPEIRKGYASWIDWGTHPDRQPVEVCWHHIVLHAARRMAVTLGETEDLAWYDERLQSIAENFDEAFWRGTHYGSEGKVKDERVSALAILSGLASEDKYPTLLENVLLTEYNASPHMEWLIQEAIGKVTAVRANDSVIWKDGEFSENATGITFAGEDDAHLKFRVPAGTWRFSATALKPE